MNAFLFATIVWVAASMTALWLLSLRLRDASIVDIWWGPGFVAIGLVSFVCAETPGPRAGLLLALIALWGLRLGGYLLWRNQGRGEDPRYQAMRRTWAARFPLVSLVTVFGLQGLLMWLVSLPLQVGIGADAGAALGLRDAIGAALFATGLGFETLGDWQLARFRAKPENAGRVLEHGLWRYTRHPNYFGDALAHWGIFIVALGTEGALVTLLSPALMTLLLLRVSGAALLERSIAKRRPDYSAYQQRANMFVPGPPKRVATQRGDDSRQPGPRSGG